MGDVVHGEGRVNNRPKQNGKVDRSIRRTTFGSRVAFFILSVLVLIGAVLFGVHAGTSGQYQEFIKYSESHVENQKWAQVPLKWFSSIDAESEVHKAATVSNMVNLQANMRLDLDELKRDKRCESYQIKVIQKNIAESLLLLKQQSEAAEIIKDISKGVCLK